MASWKGGEKTKRILQQISIAARKAGRLKVGFLAGNIHPNSDLPTAAIAAIHEYGAPKANIPSRPFFRTMIREKSPEWPKAIANLLVANNYDSKLTLEQTGQAIKGQLQQSINNFDGVPLKPATIARKGFSKQLVDTGHLVNSVDFEVG